MSFILLKLLSMVCVYIVDYTFAGLTTTTTTTITFHPSTTCV